MWRILQTINLSRIVAICKVCAYASRLIFVIGMKRERERERREWVCSIESTESSVKFSTVNVDPRESDRLSQKSSRSTRGSLVINSLSNDALCPPIISAPPSRILSPLSSPRYFTFVHRRNEPMFQHQIDFWVIPSDLLVESLVWLLWMDSGQEL